MATIDPVPASLPRDRWELPTFTVEEIALKRSSWVTLVFVLNEGDRIRRQLARMKPHADLVDIVVADGGSSDGALERGVLEGASVRALLTKTSAGRLGAQMRMGFAWALDQGYEGIITVDGNDKDDPAGLPGFVAALRDGVDHAQGSRFIPGGRSIHCPKSRWLGIKLIHAPLMSLAAGERITDSTNGFRAYSRRFLLDPKVNPFRTIFTGYELHYYLAIRAARLGYRVREVPVTRAYPAHGPAPTKISPIKGNLKVLACLFKACAGHYNPVDGST